MEQGILYLSHLAAPRELVWRKPYSLFHRPYTWCVPNLPEATHELQRGLPPKHQALGSTHPSPGSYAALAANQAL